MFFRKKKPRPREFDREHLRPVIRSSICTGAQTLGFQNIETGKFTEYMLLRSDEDLRQFREEFGVEEIPTIY